MLNCLGQYYKAKGLLAVEVRPMQAIRECFQPDKKACVLERACIVANKGAKGPIFEGNMLPQKMSSFFLPR
jgi:hypothetical protein